MAAPGFEFFSSQDPGAPPLYGAAGRMIAVLDWVLVTKGGWSKPFSGTNLAAYRSAGGNRFYLRVDDTQTTYARLRGYRAMTAISSGSNIFPATAYAATATWGAAKSIAAGTVPRKYWGIRTNRYLALYVEPGDPGSDGAVLRNLFAFGDIPSFCESDSFNTVLLGSDSPLALCFPVGYAMNNIQLSTLAPAISGPHMAASPSGAVNSCTTSMSCEATIGAQTYAAADANYLKSGRLQFKDFTLYSAEVAVPSPGPAIARAYLPNIKCGLGVIPNAHLTDGDTFSVGVRSFKALAVNPYDPYSDGGAGFASGYILLETSDTDGAL